MSANGKLWQKQLGELTHAFGISNTTRATSFWIYSFVTLSNTATEKLIKGEIKMREIAVRGFINDKFNTTYGKGLFRRAVFNGSVEIRDPYAKYLVDYMDFNAWQHKAKEFQLPHVTTAYDEGLDHVPNALFSWILRYDSMTKTKSSVDGFSVYLPDSHAMYITIIDEDNDVVDEWTLQTHGCKSTGQGKPVFIATNMDLTNSLQTA